MLARCFGVVVVLLVLAGSFAVNRSARSFEPAKLEQPKLCEPSPCIAE